MVNNTTSSDASVDYSGIYWNDFDLVNKKIK